MAEKLMNFPVGDFCFQNSVLDDFRYSSGSLELIVSSDGGDVNSRLKVLFDWVHSFRLTDEGDLLKMLSEHKGYLTTGIHLVENSHYLAWFNQQSANVHANDGIVHYLIVTSNDVVDVLSSERPLVSLIFD